MFGKGYYRFVPANKWRSRTAEDLFKSSSIHNVRSAGTASSAQVKVSEKLLIWAELILVMEKRHRDQLREKFSVAMEDKEIIVLNIPDEYQYMDEELIEILKTSVEPYLG
ncbi:low molecular weight protein tyrosine phosphatase family protein [Pedobacter nyackensis]|uniref:Protein-tyrosine phosphatase n=1 Tax=Pedobacter nyackensis TaxID=475255 RepID=A0A1W2AK19_9SPHI|nr:protein tyrosine phosphatase [Pedobacter nyackensis]SMC60993.1 protein-tyrosine phosphatase [Pedobacter nyackensis]